MKKIILILCLCIICITGNAEHFWLMFGGEAASILGEGEGNNIYGWGGGCYMELGFSGKDGLGWNFGMSVYFLENKVGESSVFCTSIPIYFDIRYLIDLSKSRYGTFTVSPFILLGSYIAPTTYDTITGNDLLIGITSGLGIYLNFGNIYVADLLVKPCYIIGNDLGQSFGIEIQAGIGIGM